MLYYVIALIVIAIDQVSKWAVREYMVYGDSIPVLGESFFQLTSHRNRGAAFGILQDQRWFFIVITTAVVIGLIIFIYRMHKNSSKRLFTFALSLILGGAIGNFIDRIAFGEVTDFFHFTFIFQVFGWNVDYEFAIFNVADCGIVVGAILIVLDALLDWNRERKSKGSEHESIEEGNA